MEGSSFERSMRVKGTPAAAYAGFLAHTWRGGGGLSLGPLLQIAKAGDEQTGLDCERVIYPLGLREVIVTVDYPRRLEYKVANPSWIRGFPASSHRGILTFEEEESGAAVITWRASWVPRPGATWLLDRMASSFLRSMCKSLEKHLS